MNARKVTVAFWSTGAPTTVDLKKDPAEYGRADASAAVGGSVVPVGVRVEVGVDELGFSREVTVTVAVVVEVRVLVTVEVGVRVVVGVAVACHELTVAAHDSSAPSRCWVHAHESMSAQGGV